MNDFEKLKADIINAQTTIFSPILEIIESAEEDAQKFYVKGVRSAGNRLKKKNARCSQSDQASSN